MHISEFVSRIEDYVAGPVSRSLVEAVLDLHIAIERSHDDSNDYVAYSETLETHQAAIRKGTSILRNYARQIHPPHVEQMQDEFYSFTNSSKYCTDAVTISVVGSVLSSSWNGINNWLD